MSVYKVIELIGTSTESWEDAAKSAVTLAGQSLRDLRVAEVVEQDLDLGDGGAITYRTKLRISFKYEGGAGRGGASGVGARGGVAPAKSSRPLRPRYRPGPRRPPVLPLAPGTGAPRQAATSRDGTGARPRAKEKV